MFKVGDWVRYITGKTKTVARVDITGEIPNYIGVSTGENVHIEDCELWQPKEGEWCWFWSEGLLSPHIMEFTHMGKDGKGFCSGFAGYDYCEPFIGELPSFLKDGE